MTTKERNGDMNEIMITYICIAAILGFLLPKRMGYKKAMLWPIWIIAIPVAILGTFIGWSLVTACDILEI